MPRLSVAVIAKHAYDAGFTDLDDLKEAVAYALAASGGVSDAVSTVPTVINATWDSRIGLWQVRSKKADKGKGTERDRDKLLDPGFNAAAIRQITGATGSWAELSPVSARAAFFKLMPDVAAAARVARGSTDPLDKAAAGGADAVTGAVKDAKDAATATAAGITDISEAVRATAGWLADRNNMVRIGKGIIGAALLIGAVYIIAKPVIR